MSKEKKQPVLTEEISEILCNLQEDTALPLELIGAIDDACRSLVAHPVGLTYDQMIATFLLLQTLRKDIETLSNHKF